MADAPNTVATLSGLFKVVYADKLQDLIPDFAILQKKIELVGADKETGNYYAQPVNLSQEAGFTYNGEAGSVVTLSDAIAGTLKEAQVKGSELILRAQMSYVALSRASKQGAKAFKRASAWKVEDMNNSMRKRLELAMLHGRMGLGIVSANGGSGALTLTDASWAGGIWAGMEGAVLEAWTSTASGATQHNGDLVISAVDVDSKLVTVTGTSAAVAANDVLYFKGARGASTFNEMAGLRAIIVNATTLFNIDASAYSLWKGNSVSSFGQPSFAKLQDAIARAVNKGLMEKVIVLVSPKCFAVLNSDQAALRVFDSSYSKGKGENGFESLVFHSTNGQCEVISHPFVKDGEMFVVPLDSAMRIGSCDVSFGVPGMDEEFFTLVSGKNAVEIQCMTDQAIFLEKPAHAVYMSGITY